MQCVQVLSGLALRRIFTRQRDGDAVGIRADDFEDWLDCANQHVARALRQANARAWVAIEVILAGEPLWERAQVDWERRLEEGFFRPLRALLDDVSRAPLDDLNSAEFDALRQALASALRSGVLTTGSLGPLDLIEPLTATRSARDWVTEEWELLRLLGKELEWSSAPGLGTLIELRGGDGLPLLVSLVAAVFRHAVLADPDLFGGLAAQLSQHALSRREQALAELAAALDVHRARFDALLQGPQTPAEPISSLRPSDGNAEARLQRGRLHAQRGDFDLAIAEFTAALQLDPTLVSAYVERGNAHRFKGDNPQAIGDYTSVLRLEPDHIAALLNRGQAYWLSRQHAEAVVDFTAVLQQNALHGGAYHFRGKVHLDSGDLHSAVQDFTEAQRLAPTSPWPCHDRGDAYAALAEFERAVADYTQALRLNPQSTLSYVRRADAHSSLGAFDQAIGDYSHALNLDPLNAAAYLSRGVAYRQLGQLEQATSDFTRALELDDANAEVFYQRGRVLHQLGDHERAIEDLDAAIRIEGENSELYFQRGQAVSALGNTQLAFADFSEAIRLNPEFSEALISRGLLFAAKGRNDQALRDYSAALRVDPRCAAAYAHRARVLIRMGLLDDAIADCGRAIEHEPKLMVAHIVRASALAQRGQFPEAVDDLTRALAIDPHHVHAFFLRGVANAKTGRVSQALADLNTVIRMDPKHSRAFAQRAMVLRDAQQHAHAVNDMAHAARLNSRYAAAYCEQLAIFHGANGEHERAVADYSVALLLDPKNRAFREAKEQAWRAFQDRLRTARQTSESVKRPVRIAAETMMAQPALITSTDLPAVNEPAPGVNEDTSFEITTDDAPAETSAQDEACPLSSEPAPGGDEDTGFVLNLPPDQPADAVVQAEQADVTVVEEDALAPAGDATAQEPVVENAPAHMPGHSEASPEQTDGDAFAKEQEMLGRQEEDRKAKIAEVLRRQEEEKRAKEETEKRKKEREKQKKRRADEDDDDTPRLALWKKGMIAAAACVALWFVGAVSMDLYGNYQSRAPITLDRICRDFAADAASASRKYEGGVFQLTGKAKMVKTVQDVRLALETSQVPDWAVHCKFDMTPKNYKRVIVDGVKPGEEVTVVGRCTFQHKEGKGVILLEECELRKGL